MPVTAILTEDGSRLPRFLHHFYADLFGYFWLPCPLCGEMYGGHEFGYVTVRRDGKLLSTCNRHVASAEVDL